MNSSGPGYEGGIAAGPIPTSPYLPTLTDVALVPVSAWNAGAPNVGDPWTFDGIGTYLSPVAPAVGFSPGSGLVVA